MQMLRAKKELDAVPDVCWYQEQDMSDEASGCAATASDSADSAHLMQQVPSSLDC